MSECKTFDRRHAAIAISNGACNPSGIANAIVQACTEIREGENRGTLAMTRDPAIRLMVFQLAYICGFRESGLETADGGDFGSWRSACRD